MKKRAIIITMSLFALFSAPLFGQQFDFPSAGISLLTPEGWNIQKNRSSISSTSPDGLASFYCAIIDPLKSKDALLEAAEIFTSEIEQFSFNNEGEIKQINGLDCFRIQGFGFINHAKIQVLLAFYTTPSNDMLIVASVYSEAYGQLYKEALLQSELSIQKIMRPQR